MDFEKLSNFKNTSLCYKLYGENFKPDEAKSSNSEVPEIKEMSGEDKAKLDYLV